MRPAVQFGAFALPFLLLSTAVHAQRTGLGLKIGPQLCYTPSELLGTSIIPGGVAGIYIPWGIAKRMELQPELLLSAMGSGYVEPDNDRYTVRTLYIQAPLNFKFYVSNTINFHLGAQAAYILRATRSDDASGTNLSDQYNSVEYGITGGLGADLRSGLDFTMRYVNGMTPILANDQMLFPRNRSIGLTIGYRLIQFKPNLVRKRR